MISEIVCPNETGGRCIQLVLPMSVSISDVEDQQVQSRSKIIYVPSGCIDSHQIKKQNKKKDKRGESRKNNKLSRRIAHSW